MPCDLEFSVAVLYHIIGDIGKLSPKVLLGAKKTNTLGPPKRGKYYRVVLAKHFVQAITERKVYTKFEDNPSKIATYRAQINIYKRIQTQINIYPWFRVWDVTTMVI